MLRATGFAIMLKITIHDSVQEVCFHLEGRLAGPWVDELRQCWQTASSTTAGRRTMVDLAEVDYVDPAGQALLADMCHTGVHLDAVTPLIQSLVERISRTPVCATVEGDSLPSKHVVNRSANRA
jgi:ABC-type transporter Mla MlaB component